MRQRVWLIEENVPGELINHSAYFSSVRYFHMGTWWEELRDNDDFNFIGEEYDDED